MGSDPRPPAWHDGERAARALRFELGLGYAPIDIYDVIAQRGVALAFRDLGEDDGRYVFHAGQGLIIVNSTCGQASRQRFTAAHELGHHELHRFSEDDETPTYLVDRNIYETGGDRREVEANAFAAAILLPTEALKAEFPTRGKVEIEQVTEIMRRYGVSLKTAVFRLHNSSRITARTRDLLLQEGEGRVRELLGKVDEPIGSIPPAALERSLIKLYRAGLLDTERLSVGLGLTVDDVVERFGSPEPPTTNAAELLAELETPEP